MQSLRLIIGLRANKLCIINNGITRRRKLYAGELDRVNNPFRLHQCLKGFGSVRNDSYTETIRFRFNGVDLNPANGMRLFLKLTSGKSNASLKSRYRRLICGRSLIKFPR